MNDKDDGKVPLISEELPIRCDVFHEEKYQKVKKEEALVKTAFQV